MFFIRNSNREAATETSYKPATLLKMNFFKCILQGLLPGKFQNIYFQRAFFPPKIPPVAASAIIKNSNIV